MFFLVRLDEGRQHIEAFALGRPRLRHHQRFDGFQRRTIVDFGFDGFDVHGFRPVDFGNYQGNLAAMEDA